MNEFKKKLLVQSQIVGKCGAGCGCGGDLARRDFVKMAGAGTLAFLASRAPIMAGPFTSIDFGELVPADKKLSPDWIKSLYARGSRTVYGGPGRKEELKKIGMPVGGIGAGQLYLGGDGKLWHWDVFNLWFETRGREYMNPREVTSPLDQGFTIRIKSGGKTVVKALNGNGFDNITFCGEYPIGYVSFRDEALPVEVGLEAFSPFIPLNASDSGLPATVMQYTVKNTGKDPVEVTIAGWLENVVGKREGRGVVRKIVNRIIRTKDGACLECGFDAEGDSSNRSDITFEDFEKGIYGGWKVTGIAFGDTPMETAAMASRFSRGSEGKYLAHTGYPVDPGDEEGAREGVGDLLSKPFTIERDYIAFLLGGSMDGDATRINLIVDGKEVRSMAAQASRRMMPRQFDVKDLTGKTARIQVVDADPEVGGFIGIDKIVFTDQGVETLAAFHKQPDLGTMALALLEQGDGDMAWAALPDGELTEVVFDEKEWAEEAEVRRVLADKLTGAVSRKLVLQSGEQKTITFGIAWYFPNLLLEDGSGRYNPFMNLDGKGRHYATRFISAAAVLDYLATNLNRLTTQTRLWHDTWYDSTLPYWFLDRTFVNTSILATSTCVRFSNGRLWGWEGVGCCPGTCTHVWHYAQAVGRIFPELESDIRERVDYGIGYVDATGMIRYRGECEGGVNKDLDAADGQAGSILRVYREHQMSGDSTFLRRLWPKVRLSLEWLTTFDGDHDGLLEKSHHNTLDRNFVGANAWISGLYIAAMRAGEAMAREFGDQEFALRAQQIAEKGSKALVEKLYNGEYFIQMTGIGSSGTGSGCHIDQVLGQSWAHQVNLGRIFPQDKTLSALKSLWKYNFAPDVGPYRRELGKTGRWFAAAGEAGLLMCTWPDGNGTPEGFYNECMTGFEHQVASHMIAEGMVEEGLAVTRAIHDRYHAARRNPFNEMECGEHYSRAMASYGTFVTSCGFEYHGPKGHIGFAPKLTPENFKAAFTAAEGWGCYEQERQKSEFRSRISMKYGKLRLKTIALGLMKDTKSEVVKVFLNGQFIAANVRIADGKALIAMEAEIVIEAGRELEIALG